MHSVTQIFAMNSGDDSPSSLPDLENFDSASQMARPGTDVQPVPETRWRCSAWSYVDCSSTL